ncbi:hypothetical protein ACN38_g10730 [Penicillium nordicum]|uniref:Uncharacterized protein n=1 Tax=Penicillium nordicum TaxID=229535 RepID=A0A0N0RXV3_9EURO|nr:hypothetical protein ACN38_g10730 [Penicillium nordicum]
MNHICFVFELHQNFHQNLRAHWFKPRSGHFYVLSGKALYSIPTGLANLPVSREPAVILSILPPNGSTA